jgi:hypothetical protein
LVNVLNGGIDESQGESGVDLHGVLLKIT